MKRAHFSFAFLLVIGTLVCQAQQDPRIVQYLKARESSKLPATYVDELFPEWQLSKMYNLCMMVSNRMKDNNPAGGFTYLYQRRLYEAAKVDTTTDSKEVIAKKIAAVWVVSEQLDQLLCSGAQFDVTKGNILKWAVSYKFDDFINDILKWKVPLNKIDASDNRTLLDYIQFHLVRNKGNALEPMFQDYYEKFRAAGAKHRAEL